MKLIIKLFGILMILSGISFLISPEIIFSWIENKMENSTLYTLAIVVRLVLGILFILAAQQSKYPGGIKFFGYLFIVAAIIIIFIGQESLYGFISSALPDAHLFAPISGLLGILFGGFLFYSFLRKKEIVQK